MLAPEDGNSVLPGALPFLLLLACPLMHLFMHHGHSAHGSYENSERSNK